jgi:hypothetical protein
MFSLVSNFYQRYCFCYKIDLVKRKDTTQFPLSNSTNNTFLSPRLADILTGIGLIVMGTVYLLLCLLVHVLEHRNWKGQASITTSGLAIHLDILLLGLLLETVDTFNVAVSHSRSCYCCRLVEVQGSYNRGVAWAVGIRSGDNKNSTHRPYKLNAKENTRFTEAGYW